MDKFKSTTDILNFAVEREQDAANFYLEMAAKTRNAGMRATFAQFAREELAHKATLLKLRDEGVSPFAQEAVQDLKIADYIVRSGHGDEPTYEQALVLAMKREKAAHRLYLALSERVQDARYKALFLVLAQEEARHKLRFEQEYDELVLREN